MSTKAETVLEEIKALSLPEQQAVWQELRVLNKVQQRAALERLRGSSAGKGLLDKLLAARARERAHG
jgi:hypothetical protein